MQTYDAIKLPDAFLFPDIVLYSNSFDSGIKLVGYITPGQTVV